MSQASGFDLSKLSKGEKIVGGAAILYIIWVFIPTWYSCCSVAGVGNIEIAGVNGFRGLMIVAWLLAVVAIAEIVLRRIANTNLNLPMQTGQIHLIVAGIALLCTLLGLVIKPGAFGVSASLSWGLFVGIVIAAAWTYGAYMMYSQPADASASGGSGGAMPPPPAPGGF